MPIDSLASGMLGTRGVDLVAATVGQTIRDISTPASATITAAAPRAGVEIVGHASVRLDLIVSAASGTTPSMTVAIETSYDNGVTDAWRNVGTFPAVTAAGTTRRSFGPVDRWVRANPSTVSGTTPSFTYSLAGEAV